MDIESVRLYALSLHSDVTEELFAEQWVVFRIGGKWFLLMQLDAPAPRVAVKSPPEQAVELRERYDGVRPAYHMNKKHWNDLYLNLLNDDFVKEQIAISFHLVKNRLPKSMKIS